MGMKFLNKKGWHTGSLRNIENVWKAEQKQEAEQRKLEELRKQIQQEREKDEFRILQEKAGIIPRQERLEFLYESGLAVGKGSNANSDGFKVALESSSSASLPQSANNIPSAAATTQQQPSVPGALFEEKPQSANDTWRKLHSDPLLLIRQREQESLARVKNNPVQMAIIRNSVEANKSKEKNSRSKDPREKKHHKKKSKHHKHSSSIGEEDQADVRVSKRSSKADELSDKIDYASDRKQRKKHHKESSSSVEEMSTHTRKEKSSRDDERLGKMDYVSKREVRSDQRSHGRRHRDSSIEDEGRLKYNRGDVKSSRSDERPDKMDYVYERGDRKRDLGKPKYDDEDNKDYKSDNKRMKEEEGQHSHYKRPHHHVPRASSKLSAEERAAKLKEMQMDAELHEENRWKRIKKADEIDTINSTEASGKSNSRNFLEDAKRSVYGAEKGGSSTIEESVRRRAHYSQSKSEVGQGNAFRR